MTHKRVPPDIFSEEARLVKQQFERHLAVSPNFRQSYNAATERIDTEMKHYRSAFALPKTLEIHEAALLENQLSAAAICPEPRTQVLLKETACRLIPYGCVSAKTYEYAPGKSYIILDTGVGDFFGNVAALTYALFEQQNGRADFGLDEQPVISKLWGLALIYYDHGFKTNNEALVLPHFKFSRLSDKAAPFAITVGQAAARFFLFHEFGHIVDRAMGNVTGTHEDEYSADFFALTAIRESAVRLFAPNVEYIIIGCLLALAAIDFIESTFPGLSFTRDGKQTTFPHPPASYPSARSRLERLLGNFPAHARAKVNHNPYYQAMMSTFQKYSAIIKSGSGPSEWYWDYLENRLQAHKEGRTTTISPTLEANIRKLCKVLAELIGDKYTGPMMWSGSQVWPVTFTCENGTYVVERSPGVLVIKTPEGKQIAAIPDE